MPDQHERRPLGLDQLLERARGDVRLEVRQRGGDGQHLVDAVGRERRGVRRSVGVDQRDRDAPSGRVPDRRARR